MRFVFILMMAALVSVPPAFAGSSDDLDPQQISALAAKAEQATPKDRCYLYAKVVSAMTDLAGRQMNDGSPSEVAKSLRAIQNYASRIRTDLTDHSKKLKDAQIMMRRTAFRLTELMRGGSVNEQPDFQATLNQVNQVQSQMMLAVFQK
jgi:hypothetical protein